MPTVSIICLCFQHENFVAAALCSIFRQTYAAIQVIIVDDASQDKSSAAIKRCLLENNKKDIIFIQHTENQGNCKSFNEAFCFANGKYVVDFATDDLMLPHRIAEQVAFFEQQPPNVAAVYSNADLIDEKGNRLGTHRQQNPVLIPENIYEKIIAQTFICVPTLMFRKSVLDQLGGYDGTLAYEDYDFLARSARLYDYAFQDLVLTQKRVVKQSLGQRFRKKNNQNLLESTYRVHQKIKTMNRNRAEDIALSQSVRYHLRLSVLTEKYDSARLFYQLLKELKTLKPIDKFYFFITKIHFPLFWLYSLRIRLINSFKKFV